MVKFTLVSGTRRYIALVLSTITYVVRAYEFVLNESFSSPQNNTYTASVWVQEFLPVNTVILACLTFEDFKRLPSNYVVFDEKGQVGMVDETAPVPLLDETTRHDWLINQQRLAGYKDVGYKEGQPEFWTDFKDKEGESPDSDRKSLKVQLAEYAHRAWAGWMKYLLSKSVSMSHGGVRLPSNLVHRWKRHMDTEYADLPGEEKLSNLIEADKILFLTRRMRLQDKYFNVGENVGNFGQSGEEREGEKTVPDSEMRARAMRDRH